MRKRGYIFCVLLILAICGTFQLGACGSSKIVEGSEKSYYGIVTDRGMSVVNEGDRVGRAYVIISTSEEEICFWLQENYEYSAKIGDTVVVDSAIEEGTNLLVATEVTLEREKMDGYEKE